MEETNQKQEMAGSVIPVSSEGKQNKFKKLGMIAGIAVGTAVLIGGGYYVYANFFDSSERIWNGFVRNAVQAKYSAKSVNVESIFKFGAEKDEIMLEFNSKILSSVGAQEQQTAMDLSGRFKFPPFTTGEKPATFSLQVMSKNKKTYLKFKDAGSLSESLPKDWVYIENGAQGVAISAEDLGYDDVNKKIVDIFSKYKIISGREFVGKESIKGEEAYAYSVEIDRVELAKALTELFREYESKGLALYSAVAESGRVLGLSTLAVVPQQRMTEEQLLADIVMRSDFNSFKLWISGEDHSLLRFAFDVDMAAPKIEDSGLRAYDAQGNPIQSQLENVKFKIFVDYTQLFSENELNLEEPAAAEEMFAYLQKKREERRVQDNDSRRVSEVKVLQIILDMYYDDHGEYPKATASGMPTGLVPTYMSYEFKAPTPPGGTCTVEQNYYVYSRPQPDKYVISFCLGEALEGFNAGVNTVSN